MQSCVVRNVRGVRDDGKVRTAGDVRSDRNVRNGGSVSNEGNVRDGGMMGLTEMIEMTEKGGDRKW